ncbi:MULTISPECIES: helix-turn-helix domain-containing protein [Atlantibacter]|uniref:helix-turn-helix domain-containing protein n=1 Tax=Atlantibacter TaxID=1903434 RepID=UPI00193149DC|nr:LuxR C-terminal-related transcriptional regulator [Atlantibacter sp.]MBL7634837.1 response regulator transcription factor [Atlantibacter hermannii]MBL7676425.1 response regulator transcription factor [Atlantibacter hermannii]MCZ7833011.1 LuxR C-terminal-related transcriptional regulator [Atlantibacter hermannii]
MLHNHNRQGIVISETPLIHSGLQKVVDSYIEGMGLLHFFEVKNISNNELMRASVVIAELGGDEQKLARQCDSYYSLISRFREVHWIFLVPKACFTKAVEWLMRPETTLLSTCESIENVANAIFLGSQKVDRISHSLLMAGQESSNDEENTPLLTASEKQVLRLLGKGWGINQIAQLLKKSNKTISAQKHSAMRRLSLKTNAEMYGWINSFQGLKELNLLSMHMESQQWNNLATN